METARVISVWVDLNGRKDGYVPAYQEEADGHLKVGTPVYAWDENEPGLRAPAVVVETEPETGEALLEVDWARVEDNDDTASNSSTISRVSTTGAQPSTAKPRVRESHAPGELV